MQHHITFLLNPYRDKVRGTVRGNLQECYLFIYLGK